MEDLLYANKTEISTILRDVDIKMNIDNDISNHPKHIKVQSEKDYIMFHDKMLHSDTLNYIVEHPKLGVCDIMIINHKITDESMIMEAYANKYNVLYNNKITNILYPQFVEALLNGMNVTKMEYYDTDELIKYMKKYPKIMLPLLQNLRELYTDKYRYEYENTMDEILSICKSIIELSIYCNIPTCDPFAKLLKVLHAYNEFGYRSNTTDDKISKCVNIEVLYASGNKRITKCDPFSGSLRELHAAYDESGWCGITDDGIRLCRKIEKLHADDNGKITTCEPFAKTLKILSAVGLCGITDDGLRKCIGIECLNISENDKITTCEPFARTLCHLIAESRCGITDAGLRMCTCIEILIVDKNDKITTCKPFAKSLRVISAMDNSGITDVGLRLCKNIKYLIADENERITSCEPFATSLRMISIGGSCGICDKELVLCPNIKYMNTYKNSKIVEYKDRTDNNPHAMRLQLCWLK